jgi:hypothetical protein
MQGSIYIMFKMKRLLLFILSLLIMSFVNAPICYANSAEPPSILIIVPNAPKDLEISIGPENLKAYRTDKVIESYFTFYRNDLKSEDYTVKVITGDRTFEIILDTPLKSYNNIFTLDLKSQTLTPGKLLSRSITLLSIRIILTLMIEAIVFYLFGYRKKKSWLIFVIINLITQGALYIWLNGLFTPLVNSYIIFSLIFGEILVIVFEMIAFLIFVKEHHRPRTALYVIMANLLSLIAGGYLISVLPV